MSSGSQIMATGDPYAPTLLAYIGDPDENHQYVFVNKARPSAADSPSTSRSSPSAASAPDQHLSFERCQTVPHGTRFEPPWLALVP